MFRYVLKGDAKQVNQNYLYIVMNPNYGHLIMNIAFAWGYLQFTEKVKLIR